MIACNSTGEPADDSTRRVIRDLCASKGTAGRPCRCSPLPPVLTPPLPIYPMLNEEVVRIDRWIPVLLPPLPLLSDCVSESALSLPHVCSLSVDAYGYQVYFFQKRRDLPLRVMAVVLEEFHANVHCVRNGKSLPHLRTCLIQGVALPRLDAITRRSLVGGSGRPMKDPLVI